MSCVCSDSFRGLGVRVQGFAFEVWRSGCRVEGVAFGVWSLGCGRARASARPSMVGVRGLGVCDLGFRVYGSGIGGFGLGFRVQGLV